ncbi:MAG: heme biosynthesis HemY N-terminal domain-containing protein, partial [Pseudomonadota bacterium]
MLRALLLLAVLFGVAGGAVWLADDPGTITYTWRGNEGALSTTRAAALALAAAVLLCLFALVLGAAWRLPRTLRARRQKAAERKAETALTNAVVAVGSGDGAAATREAAQALAAHPNSAVATFIAAQAAQLAGDSVEAE